MQEVAPGSLLTPATSYFHKHHGKIHFGTFISVFAHKHSRWKSPKPPISPYLTKEGTICTKPSWDHADAPSTGKYPGKYPNLNYKYKYLPQAMVGKAPSAPAGARGTILQTGQGRSSSLTTCSDHSRAQSQIAFMALPRSLTLTHPARQPVHPRRQLPVCLGSPPARAELSTAGLFCAAQGRISCYLI